MRRLWDVLQGLVVLAVISGPIWAYSTWSDMRRVQGIEAHGVNAMASIEGGTKTMRNGQLVSFTVDLSWTDAVGARRKARKVEISSAVMHDIVIPPHINFFDSSSIETLSGAPIEIRYLPDQPDVQPIVVQDVGWRENLAPQLDFALVVSAIGIAGAGIMFAMHRQRTRAQVAP